MEKYKSDYVLYRDESDSFASSEEEESLDVFFQNQCFIDMDGKDLPKGNTEKKKVKEKQSHLWILPGINLKGKCSNQRCPGREGVWCDVGFGEFSLDQMRSKVFCRSCNLKVPTKTVKNLGYSEAKVIFQGIIERKGQQTPFKFQSIQSNGKLQLLQEGIQNLDDFAYLNITSKYLQ